MEMLEALGFHFDPVNALLVVIGGTAVWVSHRMTVKAQGETLAQHGKVIEKLTENLAELSRNTTRLTTLVDTHCGRISRLEVRADRNGQ